MITECEQPVVPLSKEINMISDYFELEKVRYENLHTEIKTTGDYTNKMIAPLLMIPFIENSFKHGTSKMLRNPWIKLFIHADEDVLHFTLANNKQVIKALPILKSIFTKDKNWKELTRRLPPVGLLTVTQEDLEK